MTLLTPEIRAIPKVDFHVHLEGTITVAMVRKLSAKNGIPIPDSLLAGDGDGFYWQDDGTAMDALRAFVKAYDLACSVMKTAQDYTDITYDYLSRVAAEGCIYAEITISADHGLELGLTYPQMLDAITAGYEKAKAESGIEARFISTCVRHYGPKKALIVGQLTQAHPHPLVTGFGMAGDENAYSVEDFKDAFDAAGDLGRTAHAGEAAGERSIRDARDILGLRRFGHMVRTIDDAQLLAEQVAINAVPEVCVSSNLVLKAFDSYATHPLRKFYDAGLKVTLGSDDPTFFKTSIGREYQIAHDEFGFTPLELLRLTRNALEEAFIDEPTRQKLLQRVASFQ